MYSPIFVVGTGRSGTHFLTSILISSSELTDLTGGKENPLVFNKVTNSVIKQKDHPDLVSDYDGLVKKAYPLRLVDQCHPNLWRSRTILDQFPDSCFLCMVRDPFSVTFSTLNHPGVRARIEGEKWKSYPFPSPFFGLEGPFLEKYAEYSLVERSALRWCAHMLEASRCIKTYKENFMAVNYENFLTDSDSECTKISSFLKLKNTLIVQRPKIESLHKAKGLSDIQVEEIKKVIISYFTHFGLPDEQVIPVKKYLQH